MSRVILCEGRKMTENRQISLDKPVFFEYDLAEKCVDKEEYSPHSDAEKGRSVQAQRSREEGRFGAVRLNAVSRDGTSRYRGRSARLCREFRWYHGIAMPP